MAGSRAGGVPEDPVGRTRAARVADVLRDRLIGGEIAPGTPLRDVELSAHLAVSRSTVRDAFAILRNDGLLVHALHRGVEVARLDAAAVRDIYAARRFVELAGIRRLVAGADDRLDPLAHALEAMRAATAVRDGRALVEADVDFHVAVAAASESRRLAEAARRALLELRLVWGAEDRAGVAGDQVEPHALVLAALVRGDERDAVEALERHLLDSEARICAQLDAAALG
jgi:DNA-binding GntR family transcriptional regulator